MLKGIANIAFDTLKKVVQAAFELGKTIAEFTVSMVEFTYRSAARFIEAALEVGVAVVEMLETVVERGYFVLRKIINGVLQALGPVGDILDWLITRGEDLASRALAAGRAGDPVREEERDRGPRLGDDPGRRGVRHASCRRSRKSAPRSPT